VRDESRDSTALHSAFYGKVPAPRRDPSRRTDDEIERRWSVYHRAGHVFGGRLRRSRHWSRYFGHLVRQWLRLRGRVSRRPARLSGSMNYQVLKDSCDVLARERATTGHFVRVSGKQHRGATNLPLSRCGRTHLRTIGLLRSALRPHRPPALAVPRWLWLLPESLRQLTNGWVSPASTSLPDARHGHRVVGPLVLSPPAREQYRSKPAKPVLPAPRAPPRYVGLPCPRQAGGVGRAAGAEAREPRSRADGRCRGGN
jgi:hypothetical protein